MRLGGSGTALGMSPPLRETESERRPVATGEDLAELLATQHEELRETWSRVPLLRAGAREDVFLHARRRLAVHLALEQVVLAPRLGLDADEREAALERAVVGAEHEGREAVGFEAACAAVVAAFLRHSDAQEQLVLTGVLPDPDRAAVDTALALWNGSGDAYLGNTWAEMRATAVAQLSSGA